MSASTADDPHPRAPGTSASPPPPLTIHNPSDPSNSASKASPTPSTSALPPPDQAQIDSHLAAVRRRSIAHVAHGPRVLGRPEGAVLLGGVEPQEGDEQDMRNYGEEADDLLRSATVEMEAFRNAMQEGIKLFREDLEAGFVEVGFDERGQEGGQEEEETRQEYVWDVLFENQRGIYFLGKAYFSSQTLLPADPTAYTLPSQAIPSASSITVAQPSPSTSEPSPASPAQDDTSDSPAPASSRRAKTSASASVGDDKTRGSRPIDTAYTPETFQTPSPDWEWVTPWMANMRLGTDEAGWKYNAWFRRGGWRSHAGPAGWWGWVRRREWVRLRRMKQKVEVIHVDEAAKVERLEREDESGEDDTVDRLDKALRESEDGGDVGELVRAVLRVMGTIPLDRRKMEVWEAWLGKVDDKSKGKLQAVLDEPRAVEELRRGMTYHPTYIALLDLFKSHGLSIASTSNISADHPGDFLPSPEPPTKPDPTSSDSGYAV